MKNGKKTIHEPIAIIGMAFRFPGGIHDEQSFWNVLENGQDVVSEISSDRWATDTLLHPQRNEPGRSITFAAGVLSDVGAFDAGFFGISPREASWLDPQQRLLLELAWEAFENGGQVPSHLAGTNVSVHVGMSSLDYGVRGIADLSSISSHTMTGNTLSMAANRLSYVFDFHGPSMTVDTACSSSMVALHQACNSLRNGEAPLALVGSVSLLLHPYPFIGFTKASMISASGRCRAFDAAADGYVRSEGGSMLILKPLSKAQADNDTIHAVIRATGVNADGSRKTGITIPSPDGQAELMQSVLQAAGITPDELDYLEAHGTGTAVGDPIETKAIGNVYGKNRQSPLPIGSVKTNMGHLEAASGMAGLIKTVLMLKHHTLPPSLHLSTPNPNIPFDDWNLRVVTECAPLATSPHKPGAVMAVNSFGFGGTNAHIILSAHKPKRKSARRLDNVLPPLFLSARSDEALRAMASHYAQCIKEQPKQYYDTAYSAAFHRQHLEKRLAFFAKDPAEMVTNLERFARRSNVRNLIEEPCLKHGNGIVFVYTGNGAHWTGMGKTLLAESPRFAEIMQELDAAMAEPAEFSILKEIAASPEQSRLDDTKITQPVLFAIQVALTMMLREQGIIPTATIGHSVGEVAAAWAAGALTLAQAIDVVCVRSAAQAQTRGKGRMAAIALSEQKIEEVLKNCGLHSLEIAGVNSPTGVTVAGPLEDLIQLKNYCQDRQIFFHLLDLEYAFHSKAMDEVRHLFTSRLSRLTPDSTTITFVSTVTGDSMKGRALTTDYWWKNVRNPVRFADGISSLIQQGHRLFVEIGPHPILGRYINECLNGENVSGRVLATLRRGDDSAARMQAAALSLHLLQEKPNLQAYFPHKGQFVPLPNYPWQREHYWLTPTNESYGLIERHRIHPLLGWRLKEHEAAWENVLDDAIMPYLAHHKVSGTVVFPAAGYVEIAFAVAHEWFAGDSVEIEALEILCPMALSHDHARQLRVEFSPKDGGLRILSRERLSSDPWHLHTTCRILGTPMRAPQAEVHRFDERQSTSISAQAHYRLAQMVGLDYGIDFQGFTQGTLANDWIEGEIMVSASLQENCESYILHPVLLDSCFQSLIHFYHKDIESGQGMPLLPTRIGRLRYIRQGSITRFQLHISRKTRRTVHADCVLLNANNEVLCALEDCTFRFAFTHRHKTHDPAAWITLPKLIPHPQSPSQPLPEYLALHAAFAQEWLSQYGIQPRQKDYFQNSAPLMEALVIAYMYEAFVELDASDPAWLTRVMTPLSSMNEAQRPFVAWIGNCLHGATLLEESNGQWTLRTDNAPPPAQDIWQTLMAESSHLFPELLSIGRIGIRLADILSGKESVSTLTHSLHHSHCLETLHDATPPYNATTECIIEMMRQTLACWPENRRLRILQLSCANRTLARHIMPHCDKHKVDYVIAEANQEEIGHIEAEYHAYPFVKVVAANAASFNFDDEESLKGQYDIIIVHHWLQQVPDVEVHLDALRGLLTGGGKIVIAERHTNLITNFIFGLSPEWWSATPYASSRLRVPTQWSALLESQGWNNVELVTEPSDTAHRGTYLVFAEAPVYTISRPVLARQSWLIIDTTAPQAKGLSTSLVAALGDTQQHVALLNAYTSSGQCILDDPTPFDFVTAQKQSEQGVFDHVVYICAPYEANEPDIVDTHCQHALHLVQAMTLDERAMPRLWLITTEGALISECMERKNILPSQAALWGFGRVVMNEYPSLSTTLIDIPADAEIESIVPSLTQELLFPDGETEIILTSSARFGVRMQQISLSSFAPAQSINRYRLDFQVPGQLRNLLWVPETERTLQPHEIEIHTTAVGLNFRDVMYALGVLPDEAVENGFAGATLGLEFSGTVSRVGTNVLDYQPGDKVMGFGPACFASHIITTKDAVAPMPAHWSFAQAASIPTVFFTVYYALKHLANLQSGEKILIHGAAGGVGIAAIQIAKSLGAEIYATAGNDEKRDFVQLLGADHVLDSRSLAFAEDILLLTDGEGIDVILNSLAGEAITRNLHVLKPFGRFLELGKRDFYENTHIGLRPFKDNISYFGIDADQLLLAKPALASKLFKEMMQLFHDGTFHPLPHRLFGAERIMDAFRYMQQSRHIGKIVVGFEGANVQFSTLLPARNTIQMHKDASYLITGGLSGFGLETARWLAERGAGHIVLLGRRGAQTPGIAATIKELEALGSQIHIYSCDITNISALETLFATIQNQLPPLRGIIHAAMVLDDSIIQNLDSSRLASVLAPKIRGAWNLHQCSQSLPLDYFILYSSITTFIGNPGQSNYVAANGYLEGFAQWLRVQGRPAYCISWGPIGDTGYLARNSAVKESLASKLGNKPMDSRQALSQLDRILQVGIPHIALADMHFSSLARLMPSLKTARFAWLRHTHESDHCADSDAMDITTLIAGKSLDEVQGIISQMLLAETSNILSTSAERINTATHMHDLGMDSLMSVELVLAIERRFGISFSAMELNGDLNSIDRISARIAQKLCNAEASPEPDKFLEFVSTIATQHATSLSHDTLEETVEEFKRKTTSKIGTAA